MEVLFAIIPQEHLVEPILEDFVSRGIRGATVFETAGMGQIIYDTIPLLARLRETSGAETTHNRTIMTLIDESQREEAIAAIERYCGELSQPNSGIIFTVPTAFVRGSTKQNVDDSQ